MLVTYINVGQCPYGWSTKACLVRIRYVKYFMAIWWICLIDLLIFVYVLVR